MAAEFTSDTFENDYILAILEHYHTDIVRLERTDVTRAAQITDSYACQITAFMNGQITQAIKTLTPNLNSPTPPDA